MFKFELDSFFATVGLLLLSVCFVSIACGKVFVSMAACSIFRVKHECYQFIFCFFPF